MAAFEVTQAISDWRRRYRHELDSDGVCDAVIAALRDCPEGCHVRQVSEVDQHPQTLDELIDAEVMAHLSQIANVEWQGTGNE